MVYDAIFFDEKRKETEIRIFLWFILKFINKNDEVSKV